MIGITQDSIALNLLIKLNFLSDSSERSLLPAQYYYRDKNIGEVLILFTNISKKREYERIINNESLFVQIDVIKLRDLFEQGGTQLIYIGRPTCKTCLLFVPILEKALVTQNMKVFYFDTDRFNSDDYRSLFELLGISLLPSLIQTYGQMRYSRMAIYHPLSAVNLWLQTRGEGTNDGH